MNKTFQEHFPSLRPNQWKRTSDPTHTYNCIAHAAGDSTRFWWPEGKAYWPPDNRRVKVNFQTFVRMFEGLGYEQCEDGSLEEGYDKIVLYVSKESRRPTHAARQQPSGIWTSKLGPNIDIDHETAECIAGGTYGVVAQFMKRKHSENIASNDA